MDVSLLRWLLVGVSVHRVISQRTFKCTENGLRSPPAITHNITGDGDVAWIQVEDDEHGNTYEYTLVFDAYVKIWETHNTQITTRLFNGYFPSQTLRMQRGKQYRVHLVNNLGPESEDNPTDLNVWRDVNTTNVRFVILFKSFGVHYNLLCNVSLFLLEYGTDSYSWSVRQYLISSFAPSVSVRCEQAYI